MQHQEAQIGQKVFVCISEYRKSQYQFGGGNFFYHYSNDAKQLPLPDYVNYTGEIVQLCCNIDCNVLFENGFLALILPYKTLCLK